VTCAPYARFQRHVAGFVVAAAATACASSPAPSVPIIQPGAPGQASRVISAEAAASLAQAPDSDADVRFMQGMIAHHAQAIEMTGLLETRTRSAVMKKLAARIQVSQADEIMMMREWLESRGAPVPSEHAHHAPGAPRMPGMLSSEEMARLSAASGETFDRLFLEYMIKHHEGALLMVSELFATPGAAQNSVINAFASDVYADQRMEIARMTAMLKELQK
jgi:uncharacterized protein (DUF305 family)